MKVTDELSFNFVRMDIDECISDLLLTEDKLTVAGFGSFILEELPSAIHPGEHSFKPPSKKISFDTSLKETDNILEKCLMEKFHLSEDEVRLSIRNFVSDLKHALQEKGAYELGSVGKFYYDIEKQLKFAAAPSKNFLLTSYGLPEFVSKPILRTENIPVPASVKQEPEKKKRKFIWFRF